MSTLYKRKKSPYWVYASSFRGKRLRISTGMRQKSHAQQVQFDWDMKLFKSDLSFANCLYHVPNDIDAFMDEYLKVRKRVSNNTANTASSVLKRFKCFLKDRGIRSIAEINIKVLDDYIDHLYLYANHIFQVGLSHSHLLQYYLVIGHEK